MAGPHDSRYSRSGRRSDRRPDGSRDAFARSTRAGSSTGSNTGSNTGSSTAPPDPIGDTVYDAYLEAALAGEVDSPEEHLARYPDLDAAAHAELLDRLTAIGALVRPPAPPGAAPDLGEYRLIRRLGGGAMGDVHLAEQITLGRLVAIKTQRAELASSPRALARFEREAQALAQIAHPSVVGVHGFGREGDLRYLVMELVPGRSLKELLDEPREGEAPPTAVRVAKWGVELALGLDAVHTAGLLHRDVKPSNVRIREDGRAVLVDFGLARSSTESELSRPGEFIGSPAYAAPEQVQGVPDLDARADVYSLGATLYHALAGRPPFTASSVEGVLHAVLHKDPPRLRTLNPALPRDLELVLAKALEKTRDARYATAREFAADLQAVLELRPIAAKPVGPLGRAARWARRNRVAAASLTIAATTIALAGLGFAWKAHRTHAERLERAAGHVAAAHAAIDAYRTERRALLAEEADYDELYRLQEYQHLEAAEIDRMRSLEARVRTAREARDDTYRSVGNLLDQALALDPELAPEVNAAWATLFVERIVEAEDRGDVATRDVFMEEIERRDPDGSFRAATYPFARVTLASDVPQARAWIFRLAELDTLPGAVTEAREVPVPLDPTGSGELAFVPPRAWGRGVLCVDADAGPLRAGDIVLDVEGQHLEGGPLVAAAAHGFEVGDRVTKLGGVTLRDAWDLELGLEELGPDERRFEVQRGARIQRLVQPAGADWDVEVVDLAAWAPGRMAQVWRAGRVLTMELPGDAELRPTVAPYYLDPALAAPLDAAYELAPGRYVFVAAAPGRVLEKVYFQAEKELDVRWSFQLPAADLAPPGYALVSSATDRLATLFVKETEVTSTEYLAFLNDPATLARIDALRADGDARLYPRSAHDDGAWGMWVREEDGRFALEDDWPADWPVLGVSYEDALDYCAWLNECAEGGRYRLPTPFEYYIAGSGNYTRKFSWGDRFDQRFANTCFTRRLARPAPVRTHWHDESPFGIYDMGGNAVEWVAGWFDESRDLRYVAGGAWGQARIVDLGVLGQRGIGPEKSWGESGFRLVWEPDAR